MRPERPAAGLVIATGHFQERTLAFSLSPHFRRSWIYQLTGPAAGAAATVLPDGLIHLRWCEGKLSVAGLGSSARVEMLDANSPVAGFTFQPGAATRWLGAPASEIAGRLVSLEDLWGKRARILAERAGEARSPAESAGQIELELERRAADIGSPNPQIQGMFELLNSKAARPFGIVSQLMSELSVSARTLRRRCEDAFGYGPKTIERILRFQRFVNLVRSSTEMRLADGASAAGYADQAHLSREVRRLSNLSPKALIDQIK